VRAHGFLTEMMVELVRAGLATGDRVRAGKIEIKGVSLSEPRDREGEDQTQAGRSPPGGLLVRVEQHLTQSNENDDADDRRKEDGRKG